MHNTMKLVKSWKLDYFWGFSKDLLLISFTINCGIFQEFFNFVLGFMVV